MNALSTKAKDIAAKATGLRADQIERAVEEYRRAADSLHEEPKWQAIIHMCGPREAIHQYGADGTKVCLQINCFKVRGEWEQEKFYTLDGKPYETYGEARALELEREARPKPYGVP